MIELLICLILYHNIDNPPLIKKRVICKESSICKLITKSQLPL